MQHSTLPLLQKIPLKRAQRGEWEVVKTFGVDFPVNEDLKKKNQYSSMSPDFFLLKQYYKVVFNCFI